MSRAFWLHGVMTKAGSTHGFVVLNNKVAISHDHRISATDLNISLLREEEFEDLAKGMGGSTFPIDSAAANIDAWEVFFSMRSKHPLLADYLAFSSSRYWIIKDPGERCRKIVAKLRTIRNELDPAKADHLSIFGDALCLFLLALSELASRLFLVLLKPTTRDEFSTPLLALLYGGYENLEAAQKIKKITSGSQAADALDIFPELGKFEQLVRELLQAPQQTLPASLLARELSLMFLNGLDGTFLSRQILIENPHASKFLVMASSYLCKALRLPAEFGAHYSDYALRVSSSNLVSAKI
ncbi:hypothetical protein [Herbaspirillum huttiense]|uniref:hypothetical protein n=1 Tax=Herbaspirillum huttiense TaxID=863372 RepID=UPI0039B08C9E